MIGRFRLPRSRAERSALLALVLVLAAGGWLRFAGSDWDAGSHFHPDERYMLSLQNNLRWPDSLGGYFDVDSSPLSPYNFPGGVDYVYGTLPLFADKAVATALDDDYYGASYLVERRVSALVDLVTIVLVFLLARIALAAHGRGAATWGAVFAAALYAFAVTAIQHAHFATVESWLVLFTTLTILLAAVAVRRPLEPTRRIELAWAAVGVPLGLTGACKISGFAVAVPVAIALLGRAELARRAFDLGQAAIRVAGAAGLVLVFGYLAYRSVSPYTFAGSFWLDLSVNAHYRAALDRQREILAHASLFPPAYQWLLSHRVWSPLENLALWQLGVPFAAAALVGVGRMAFEVAAPFARRARDVAVAHVTVLAMVLAFALTVFLYFATLFAHSGRYLVPLVPALAVAGGYGAAALAPLRPRLVAGVAAAVVVATGVYALAFHAVYRETNTRVSASEWIVAHVPEGARIANEHWDDSLPAGGIAQRYEGSILPVFDADDDMKLRKLYDVLSRADYYILSSPRAWNAIGRLPDRFPLMVRFYDELFAGRLGFREAASFRSVPRLFGVKLDDLRAEEAFWVYDHPRVAVFRRTGPLGFDDFAAPLCRPTPLPGCP